MNTQFEYMTIAELRTYCVYLRKVSMRAQHLLAEYRDAHVSGRIIDEPELAAETARVLSQYEALGITNNKR